MSRVAPTLPLGDWTDYLLGYVRHVEGTATEANWTRGVWSLGPVERTGAEAIDRREDVKATAARVLA